MDNTTLRKLTENALLVRLEISNWTGRKHDKKVTKAANKMFEAVDGGRFNKILVDAKRLKEIQSVAQAARMYHYDNTLPWTDEGLRLLPTANYNRYVEEMAKLKNNYNSMIEQFVRDYSDLVDYAKLQLGKMFKASDYPTANCIIKKFGFETKFRPVPNDAHFEIQLPNTENLRTELKNELENAQADAMSALWNRLSKVLEKLISKLTDKNARFHKSVLSNINDVCSLIPHMNFVGDENLDRIRQLVESKIGTLSAEELKVSNRTKNKTVREVQDILNDMATFM